MNIARDLRLQFAPLLTALLTTACAAPEPTVYVVEARQAFQQVSQNPKVSQHASVQLYEAQQANEKLELAIKDREDRAEIDHLAYLAKRHSEIAQAAAEDGELKAQIKTLGEQRDQIALQARNKQVEELRTALAQAQAAHLNSRETERGLVITLGDVLFATGKATLASGAQRTLTRVAELLRSYPDREVFIEGHTDDVGDDAMNQQLSERRAQAVADSLTSRGIEKSRIQVKGLGETAPAVPNTNAASRQQNRRVEIVLSRPAQG